MKISEGIIQSTQNKYVSEARMLEDKKRRDKLCLFRFDGVKLLVEALARGVELSYLLVSEDKYSEVFDRLSRDFGVDGDRIECRVMPVRTSIFDKISKEKSPEGVICVAKYIDKSHNFAKINNVGKFSVETVAGQRVLLLEAVRDPQNLGAIIRSAAAFGVDRIIMSADCADIYNPKTVRASMGTLFGMKIDVTADLCEVISALREDSRRVFAAALSDTSTKLGGFETCLSDCVVIGNEGHGLSDAVISACDGTVYIPMSEGVESLNAAVAASVLMWEFFGR